MAALILPAAARADVAAEDALAQKFAPVVRLVEQPEECGPGEPFEPTDVELLFGDPTVALRGPWSPSDLVKIGPAADDLKDRYEYHLDFPGNALDPGCSYEQWARRLTASGKPTVYAHVATEAASPGRLALQYWLFYPFNDFNNTHEGDWEMIQLNFDAADARAALGVVPVEAGFSSHEGAERARWGEDEKLEIVDGTHPVIYPGAGSHANKYTSALYIGSSAEAGVGCDNTLGPHEELRPVVQTIPSDPDAASVTMPWITFEGRWGELQKAFFNGPTGPNLKTQWTQPFTWAEETWRDRSYAVPTGGIFGTGATDLFCAGVAAGSRWLIQLVRAPALTLVVLATLLVSVGILIVKATWAPVAPLRVARRRSWGQILSSSATAYARNAPLFLGVGLPLIPVTLAISLLQWLLFLVPDIVGSGTGNSAGTSAYFAIVVGATLALLGLGLVQAATARALCELDAGRPVTPWGVYRLVLRGTLRRLLGSIAIFVAVWVALTTTAILIPIAIALAVRWSLLAPIVELEERSAIDALRRSGSLVRGRWLRVGSLVGLAALGGLALGPVVGALLIFASNSALVLLNIVAGLVYVAALPFVGLVTTYTYFDARVRHELEPRDERRELPAEIA